MSDQKTKPPASVETEPGVRGGDAISREDTTGNTKRKGEPDLAGWFKCAAMSAAAKTVKRGGRR